MVLVHDLGCCKVLSSLGTSLNTNYRSWSVSPQARAFLKLRSVMAFNGWLRLIKVELRTIQALVGKLESVDLGSHLPYFAILVELAGWLGVSQDGLVTFLVLDVAHSSGYIIEKLLLVLLLYTFSMFPHSTLTTSSIRLLKLSQNWWWIYLSYPLLC